MRVPGGRFPRVGPGFCCCVVVDVVGASGGPPAMPHSAKGSGVPGIPKGGAPRVPVPVMGGSHGIIAALRGPHRSPVLPRRSSKLRERRERKEARVSGKASRLPPPLMARGGRHVSRSGSSAYSRPRLSFLPQASTPSSSLPVRPEGGACVLHGCRAVRMSPILGARLAVGWGAFGAPPAPPPPVHGLPPSRARLLGGHHHSWPEHAPL
ncbi:hypothetical protein NDU88_006427 [Pleurodeles waltl]|uniref:Uncharacterized protein n=1 Tax=Pleurodeles waltl TaxID=8319 RepID=A0AAV7WFK3_PLEWA|nr:hypothetical protein NDU88_006427 [Pleurodeles waltl]